MKYMKNLITLLQKFSIKVKANLIKLKASQ